VNSITLSQREIQAGTLIPEPFSISLLLNVLTMKVIFVYSSSVCAVTAFSLPLKKALFKYKKLT
jgi:hypothetical protein